MAAPQNEYAFSLEAALAAADRWNSRGEHHKKFESAIRKKRYSDIDTPERCAARVNRLIGKLQETAPLATEKIASEYGESVGEEISQAEVTPETVSDELLERVIGETRDFQFVEFIEEALFVSKSVGRVATRLAGGRTSYGTGFMVSPSLLITNHHVLPNNEAAARSTVEFNYQRDRLGRALEVQSFKLDPTIFFLNDERLDFALVGVASNGSGKSLLDDFGWCPLIPTLGKIVTGEPINIVQHPKGDLKQVVIRENRLLDSLDGADIFFHYEADTEPGSSGSPVFNDQWEVVALHHSGVPRKNAKGELLDTDGHVWKKGDDPSRLDWIANEGVRVSKLVEFIAEAPMTGNAKRLLAGFLEAKPPPELERLTTSRTSIPNQARNKTMPDKEEKAPMTDLANNGLGVTLTIPLHITVTLGTPESAGPVVSVDTPSLKKTRNTAEESVEIDPDYANRPGYNPAFLGFNVPFPRLTNATRPEAFALPGVSGDARFELKYYHYSVIFNKKRKLAFAAGVNLDPTAPIQFKREKDKWFYDPRVTPEEELQAGEDLYAGNPLDRGHLVRRADAGWGATEEEAKLANDDTFHFTNCSPQHAITNQGKTKITDHGQVIMAPPGLKLWGKLEEHVSSQSKAEGRKLSVFNGPVFRSTDQKYRGVLIPQEFWKLVVFANDDGEPAAAAFVLTQAELIEDLEEEFEVGEYKTVQVRVQDLESKTKLAFGPVADWDVLEHEGAQESFTRGVPAVILESVADMVL